jgi:hypothetical protein
MAENRSLIGLGIQRLPGGQLQGSYTRERKEFETRMDTD